jgi:hypothetical protein
LIRVKFADVENFYLYDSGARPAAYKTAYSMLRPPTHEGFGSRLLKRALSPQIKAAIDLDYAPAGLRAAITVVLPPPA